MKYNDAPVNVIFNNICWCISCNSKLGACCL